MTKTKNGMKNFFFSIIILTSSFVSSQSNNTVYVILNDSKLFRFIKKDSSAKLKIPLYKYKDIWLEENKTIKNDNEVVVVNSQPNIQKYFEYYSLEKPLKLTDVSSLDFFKIEDVSKEKDGVFKEIPYVILFVETVNCHEYQVWKMALNINE